MHEVHRGYGELSFILRIIEGEATESCKDTGQKMCPQKLGRGHVGVYTSGHFPVG